MPAYNARRYLEQAVNSVLRQTFRDFELIIVDDGSTDGSHGIARRLSRADGRVVAIRCEHAGNIAARNKCLEMARAPIIGWLDADDLAHPDWLHRQLDFLGANPGCVAVGGQVMLFWGDRWPIGLMERPLAHAAIDAINMAGEGGGVMNGAVLMRREAIDRAGGFDERMETVEDMHLVLQLAEIGRLANLPDVLLWRRVHLGSVSHSRLAVQHEMKLRVARLAAERRGLPARVPPGAGGARPRHELLMDYMLYAAHCGYFDTAIRLGLRILLLRPSTPGIRQTLAWSIRQKLAGRQVDAVFPGAACGDSDSSRLAARTRGSSARCTAADASRGRVLLYNPPYGNPEGAFWPRLGSELRGRGVDLYSAGCEQGDGTVPHIPLPYTLDAARSITGPNPPRAWRWPLDLQPVLDRERFFTGSDGERRERIDAAHTIAAAQAAMLAQLQPRAVVFWNGEQTHQLILRQLLQDTGCPTLRLERSPLPGILYADGTGVMAASSFAGQEVAWKNDGERRAWLDRYQACARRIVSGSATWWAGNKPERPPRNPVPVPPGARAVLFAAQVDRDTQNLLFSPHFARNVDAFRAFCELARASGNVFVIGKHHPKSDTSAEEYMDIVGDLGVWLTDVSLQECLDMADCVAGVNSSVLFEAALRGKRCLALGETLIRGRNIFYEARGPRDAETFRSWLDGADFESRQSAWSETAAWFLANHFYSMHGDGVPGLRGERELASRIADAALPARPDYTLLKGAAFSFPDADAALMQA